MRNNYILIENENISYYFDKNEIDFLKYTNGILTINSISNQSSIFISIFWIVLVVILITILIFIVSTYYKIFKYENKK